MCVLVWLKPYSKDTSVYLYRSYNAHIICPLSLRFIMSRKSKTRRNLHRPKNSTASLLKKSDRPFGGFSALSLQLKEDRVCLPFLAGKCVFTDERCLQCHPTQDEKHRLIATYKSVHCCFGDNCYTENCLYLHPYELTEQLTTPDSFPPLNGVSISPLQANNEKKSTVWKNDVASMKRIGITTPANSPTNTHMPRQQITNKESSICTFMWGTKYDTDQTSVTSNGSEGGDTAPSLSY